MMITTMFFYHAPDNYAFHLYLVRVF